jgi:Phasin protein
MPDDPRSASTPAPSKPAADPRAPLYTTLFEGNQHAFARWLAGMFALSQEITQFTQTQLQESMAVWSTLAICSGPEQALDCQRRFAAKMADQYSEEITKLSRMMMSIMAEGLTSLPQRSMVRPSAPPSAEPARR